MNCCQIFVWHAKVVKQVYWVGEVLTGKVWDFWSWKELAQIAMSKVLEKVIFVLVIIAIRLL